jgi:hypothetical protein
MSRLQKSRQPSRQGVSEMWTPTKKANESSFGHRMRGLRTRADCSGNFDLWTRSAHQRAIGHADRNTNNADIKCCCRRTYRCGVAEEKRKDVSTFNPS